MSEERTLKEDADIRDVIYQEAVIACFTTEDSASHESAALSFKSIAENSRFEHMNLGVVVVDDLGSETYVVLLVDKSAFNDELLEKNE